MTQIKFFLLFVLTYLKEIALKVWKHFFGEWYHTVFNGCIYMAERYHLETTTKSTLIRQTWLDIFMQRKRTTLLIYPTNTHDIFNVVSADGAKHLTRNSFVTMKQLENKSKTAVKVLGVVIVHDEHSIDITDFFKHYVTSMNDAENFTVKEILKIAYIEHAIPTTEFLRFHDQPCHMEVILDDVDLTTKKFEEIIVL